MGLIMVIGIVAKNGILLLDADQKFRAAGHSPPKSHDPGRTAPPAPHLMTALATVAGMLPLALALGAGSQMLQPLAIAVIGGILISMVLSLIITPAVHFYLSGHQVEPQPVVSCWLERSILRIPGAQNWGSGAGRLDPDRAAKVHNFAHLPGRE